MKIATIEFTEIVKGMYISEDKKGLVVEILDLTGLDKNVELGLSERAYLKAVRHFATSIFRIAWKEYSMMLFGNAIS